MKIRAVRFSDRPPVEVGGDAESFTVTLSNGTTFDLRETRGGLTVTAGRAGDSLCIDPKATNMIVARAVKP